MDNIIIGIKGFILGITTTITAVTSTYLAPAPTPTPLPTPVPQLQEDVVTRFGEYSYSGYTLKYVLNIPKNGGEISGAFSGVCEGPINGSFAGGGGGNVSGDAEANCKVAIFSYKLKANYTGKLYLNEGKVDINWTGEIPYTANSGSLTINFEPVN